MIKNVCKWGKGIIKKMCKWVENNVGLSITIILACVSLILWICSVGKMDFSDLWINLTAGFVSSICTMVLIDNTLKKRKEKEEVPLKLALYRDVQLLTSRFIYFWRDMYEKSNIESKTLLMDELFSEQELRIIYENLDLEGYPNVLPKQNWYTYLDRTLDDFEQRGKDILHRYVSIAEPELLQAIHYLINDSAFVGQLMVIRRVRNVDIKDGMPRIPTLHNYSNIPTENDCNSIKVIFKWCRKYYEKLKDEGQVYEIPHQVSVTGGNLETKTIISKEKIQHFSKAYEEWRKKCIQAKNE